MAFDAIEDALPKDGLLRDYINYTSGNEICPRFRVFSFIAALGSLVKRKVWFQRSSYSLFPTLFPNLWVILVAPQGRGHKSAALSIARKLVLKVEDKYQPRILASKLTPEALVKSLAAQALTAEVLKQLDATMISIVKKPAQALLYSSELGVLLGREKYNQGMIALLTDLYDTPEEWQSETVMRGDQRLYDVCLSVLGASTPDWMQTMLPSDAFKGGFMSRMLLIGYPETWHKRIADPEPANKELGAAIVERVTAIANLEGEMVWTPDAKKYFSDWYENLKEAEPGPKAGYLERKQDHLLKLAIIIQLCWAPTLVLTLDAMKASMAMLAAIEPDTLRMVEYISIEPRMRFVQRIIEELEARGEMTEGDLMNNTWKYLSRPQEFGETMNMLLKTKRVIMSMRGTELVYTYTRKD